MPTYQYRCTDCGHAFEEFQSFTDDALTVCPACGGRLRKLFNAVGVVFKGSGFYRTDSRSTSTTSSDSSGSSDSTSSTGSSESPSSGAGSSSSGAGTSSNGTSSSSKSTSSAAAASAG